MRGMLRSAQRRLHAAPSARRLLAVAAVSLVAFCPAALAHAPPPPPVVVQGRVRDGSGGATATARQHVVRACGVLDPPPARVAADELVLRDALVRVPTNFAVTIPIKFHVICSGQQGLLSAAAVTAQIAVLSSAYAGLARRADGTPGGGADTGVRFVLDELLYHDSAAGNVPEAYFSCSTNNAIAIGAALSVSPEKFLNVYSCQPSGGLLGWVSRFPQAAPESDVAHAVFVLHSTLPQGTSVPYNLGNTMVHEVGHYLGLYHTFQGGCHAHADTGMGDAVADTPPEASAAFGNGAALNVRDTCTGYGQSDSSLGPWFGLDPTSSFMDYTDDVAMTVFSPGQAARMRLMITTHKPTLCSNMPTGSCDASGGQPDEEDEEPLPSDEEDQTLLVPPPPPPPVMFLS